MKSKYEVRGVTADGRPFALGVWAVSPDRALRLTLQTLGRAVTVHCVVPL